MNLASDNIAAVSPQVMQALQEANQGSAGAYGADVWSEQLLPAFRTLFDHELLTIFPVFNGSAANATALASMMRPFNAVIAQVNSHIEQDECGMPEFFTGGKVLTAEGKNGKMIPDKVMELIKRARNNGVHHSLPSVISLTQSTEFGTVYTVEEIQKLSLIAKKERLYVHMDGARFANAVVHLGCKPADITWRCGVDVMSFGCTKNGAMLAEAIIFFNPELSLHFEYIRKRAGQLASKQRYLCAQLLAMISNNLWLKNANHANNAAKILAEHIAQLQDIAILNSVEANSVFVRFPEKIAKALLDKGHVFYHWPLLGDNVYRLVTHFQTDLEEINGFYEDCVSVCSA